VDSRWSLTLWDTSSPAEDPQKQKEIKFELSHAESVHHILLAEGTHGQGARQGSPFRADRKRHILCITPVYASPQLRSSEFVIDCGSICALASENEAASCIPWDLWQHKTTLLDKDVPSTRVLECW